MRASDVVLELRKLTLREEKKKRCRKNVVHLSSLVAIPMCAWRSWARRPSK